MIGGTCIDRAGNVGLAALPVSYDATAPQVTSAHPSRPPDANGWYNRPLAVSFRGSDAMSQVDTCTEVSYSGPDAADASVSGSCRDRAGNGSASLPLALRYDSTAPTLTQLRAKAGNGMAQLSWIASPDTTFVELRRSGVLVYSGSATSFTDRRLKNGVRYRYVLTGYDEAGNTSDERGCGEPDCSARLATCGRDRVRSAAACLAARRGGDVLQRPAVAPGKDPQRLAEGDIAPAPADVDLRRPPVPSGAGALPVVRLARLRTSRGEEVRPAARIELVRGALTRASQEPRRERQEDGVAEDEDEECEPAGQ